MPVGPAPDPAAVTGASRIAAGVVGLGVVLGVAGLFPTYVAGASLASQPPDVVAHAIYLAAWTLSGVLIVLGGMRLRAGALLGLGVSAVTFGLFFADVGTPAAERLPLAGRRPGPEHRRLACLHRRRGAGVPDRALCQAELLPGTGPSSSAGLPHVLRRLASHEIVPT